jgi:hypothetical protein
MPPLQKIAAVVGAGITGGITHSILSAANRTAIKTENARTSVPSSTITDSHINKLIDDSYISPLQEILFNSEIMSYTCLGLTYILIIQLVFKLYFKNSVSLNLSKLLGSAINTKLEYYFNKIIKLNKQVSVM